jgi:hypothetical protein
MSVVQVPRALADKLGADGTQALSALLDSKQAEWTEDMLTLAAERFDRTLGVELSKLRVDVARELSDLRQEMGRYVSDVRQDLGTARVELFKWSFLFWIGQVAAMAGLLAFMLRSGA